MISTRQNELYCSELKDWHKAEFTTADRRGAVVEQIYMNYDINTLPLHQYDYVGNGSTHRQQVKRKIARFTDKINALDTKERDLFIQAMIKQHPAEVKHFLTTFDA